MADTDNKPTPISNHVANHGCFYSAGGLEADGALKETLMKTNIKLIPIQSVLPPDFHDSSIKLCRFCACVLTLMTGTWASMAMSHSSEGKRISLKAKIFLSQFARLI